MSHSITIVGAGAAGLFSAVRFAQLFPSARVQVLTDAGSPGGRLLSRSSALADRACELGAGRFSTRRHPRVAAAVARYGLATIPFDLLRTYFRLGARRQASDGASQPPATLLRRVFSAAPRSSWPNIAFVDLMSRYLSPTQMERLVLAQGYDILLDPRLPTSEAARIIGDHPETSEERAGWFSIIPGFQQLANCLYREAVQLGVQFQWGSRVVAVQRLLRGRLQVRCADGGVHNTDRVVLSVPRRALEGMSLPFDRERQEAIASVEGIPLMKAVFLFPESWWAAAGWTEPAVLISDTPVRRLYMLRNQLMVYTDSAAARYWEPLCAEPAVSSGLLWRMLGRWVRKLLGIRASVPWAQPVEQHAKFWRDGVHFWARGRQPEDLHAQLLAVEDDIHVCSESYSPESGWVEGAFAAAERLATAVHAQAGSARLRAVHPGAA